MARLEERNTSAAREPLTQRRVFEAALALLDREGAEGLTMRRLGGELGVSAMSLYYHVAGRERLLDGVTEVIVGEIEPERGGDDPLAVLRAFMTGIRRVALAHPQAFGLTALRPLRTPGGLGPVELVLGALARIGLDDEEAVQAVGVLAGYARGFALAEAAARAGGASPAPRVGAPQGDAAFDFGVELIVEGIEARAGRAPTGAGPAA